MTAATALFDQAVEALGASAVRLGGDADSVAGATPRLVVEPANREALATALRWSASRRLGVVIRGDGTKMEWRRRADALDVVLSSRGLNRVVAHARDDLTVTVEAGARLADVNRELARHGQWLPLHGSHDEAGTIGGAIATNDSGPLRQKYGTPRDLLIGIQLATTDGRLTKSGANVVKNVAGYDLGKVMSGSFGSLAAIVGATFKLMPLPESSATLVAHFRDSRAAAEATAATSSSQLEPMAFDVRCAGSTGNADGAPPTACQLLWRFAAAPSAIEAHVRRVQTMTAAERFSTVTGAAEQRLWYEHTCGIWKAPGAVLKMSWMPASLASVLSLVGEIHGEGVRAVEFVGRAAVGAGLLRVDADAAALAAIVERIRVREASMGNVVLLRADRAAYERIDVWGPAGDAAPLLDAIKRAFDPDGILNAGAVPSDGAPADGLPRT